MSYHSWHNYGYGICTEDIEIDSVERLEKLLNCAPKFQQEVHAFLEEYCGTEKPTVDDYMEFDEDYCCGLATIMSEVILEAEGIQLLACDDYNCDKFLIYTVMYPWNATPKDKTMTKEKLDKLFQKYVSILTDKPIRIDYQAVENGG